MPIHDWSRVPSGIFHHFHQMWSVQICGALNTGLLPSGYSGLVEQRAGTLIPDVLTVRSAPPRRPQPANGKGGVLTLPEPKTRIVKNSARAVYAAKANRIVVRHGMGEVVAVIELVSPGNKDGREAVKDFLRKTLHFLRRGVHVLTIDLLPPGRFDPNGLPPLVWKRFSSGPLKIPADKPLTLASYRAGEPVKAFIEPVAVGDRLPAMPLFLSERYHVQTPLEEAYKAAWKLCSPEYREVIETGKLP